MTAQREYILTLSCPDTTGIVAAVTQFVASHKGWITAAHQYGDPITNWFFMRVVIRAASLPFELMQFKHLFEPLAKQFDMTWDIHDTAQPKRVVILVSKHDHCLADLLYRFESGELNMEMVAILSNHPDLNHFAKTHQLPYHSIDMSPQNKMRGMQALAEQLHFYQPDVIVLARFMQILPPELCAQYAGKIINIHHSFLPSFVGANPYQQAFERGVKLIGATCHYVTNELDEGPIIEQGVERVHHDYSLDEIKRLGKDVEKNVLSKGLRYHLEDRVLLHNNKTVVFN